MLTRELPGGAFSILLFFSIPLPPILFRPKPDKCYVISIGCKKFWNVVWMHCDVIRLNFEFLNRGTPFTVRVVVDDVLTLGNMNINSKFITK